MPKKLSSGGGRSERVTVSIPTSDMIDIEEIIEETGKEKAEVLRELMQTGLKVRRFQKDNGGSPIDAVATMTGNRTNI